MKTLKIGLANLQGKMNRKEMKNIMAGSGGSGHCAHCPGFIAWVPDCSAQSISNACHTSVNYIDCDNIGGCMP